MNPVYIEIDECGNKFYHKDREMGILHREDGPAVEYANGYKAWYFNDERHREDGPAVEYPSGDKAWWFEGKEYSKEEFLRLTAKEIILTMDEIAAKFGVDVSKLKITK